MRSTVSFMRDRNVQNNMNIGVDPGEDLQNQRDVLQREYIQIDENEADEIYTKAYESLEAAMSGTNLRLSDSQLIDVTDVALAAMMNVIEPQTPDVPDRFYNLISRFSYFDLLVFHAYAYPKASNLESVTKTETFK